MSNDNDNADLGSTMTQRCEQAAIELFARNAPSNHKLFVLATFDENGEEQVWSRMGTRPSCLLDLGVPGDEVDPDYALAVYDAKAKAWQYDNNSHPSLKKAVHAHIENVFSDLS